MVVYKFLTSPFEATCFRIPLHFCNISFFQKMFLQCKFDCEQIKNTLSGEHLETLSVMHCTKLLLKLSKFLNQFFWIWVNKMDIGGV